MKTLFDKIWDAHVVSSVENGPTQLYIDRHFCHEVTSPQAFNGLRARGLKVFRPEQTTMTADHNTPTINQDQPVKDPISRNQLDTFAKNAADFNMPLFYPLGHIKNGVVHIIGPENGFTQPGMTIVCGDSHTSTHGAFGSIAFGIGTSEVEMVLATQCILQSRPKTMRITFNGKLTEGVTAKDLALYMISKLTTGGATGYFVEYAGEAIRQMSMEERMTVCNLSIEMGARGGMIGVNGATDRVIEFRGSTVDAMTMESRMTLCNMAIEAGGTSGICMPDMTTVEYLWPFIQNDFTNKEAALAEYRQWASDDDAAYDKTVEIDATTLVPVATYGYKPDQVKAVSELPETRIDQVYLGSCTNGRLEDLRIAASILKGNKLAPNVRGILSPATPKIYRDAMKEGIIDIFLDAGFCVTNSTCGACLGMSNGVLADGEVCASTTNRANIK